MYRASLVGIGLVATLLLSLSSCGVMKRMDELREENDAHSTQFRGKASTPSRILLK